MRRRPVVWAVSLAVVIFLPVALAGLLVSVNEYRDMGIDGGVDCNGPLTVMLFNAPTLVVYAAGAVFYAALIRGARRSLPAAAALALCLLMAAAAGGKAWAAYREKNGPSYRETCGEGW